MRRLRVCLGSTKISHSQRPSSGRVSLTTTIRFTRSETRMKLAGSASQSMITLRCLQISSRKLLEVRGFLFGATMHSLCQKIASRAISATVGLFLLSLRSLSARLGSKTCSWTQSCQTQVFTVLSFTCKACQL